MSASDLGGMVHEISGDVEGLLPPRGVLTFDADNPGAQNERRGR